MRLRVDVSKNFSTAESSQDGEFDTSTTTEAPFSTSASPSPVRVLTPVLGAAATASCPCSRSLLTSFDPMRPVGDPHHRRHRFDDVAKLSFTPPEVLIELLKLLSGIVEGVTQDSQLIIPA